MQSLNPRVNLKTFFERISSARERVLMLDYDGTLAPFQVRPERATPYPGVVEALDEIMQGGDTRVVIISGRRAADLTRLLPLRKQPEIWGGHGWERLSPGGDFRMDEPVDSSRQALQRAADLVSGLVRIGGRIERKPASIALHWRGLPALAVAKIQDQALRLWSPLAREGTLELLRFDGGVEVRARGFTKRDAVNAVLSESAEDSAVAYLGDDMTDEDAFAAVKDRGIGVLVRPQLRETSADVWIRPPRELLEFIRHWRPKGAHG